MHRAANSVSRRGIMTGLALLAACSEPAAGPEFDDAAAPRAEIGLLTSLPIYWPESDSPADMLNAQAPMPWPRVVIERRHALLPLDALDGEQGLARVKVAVLAQPRPLSPAENVALDDWVRAGGHVLVFADPALTEHSRFHLGDRRRPQDVILLSPILTRWGLLLSFDEDAAPGQWILSDPVAGPLPVHLPGKLEISPDTDRDVTDCRIEVGAVVARCRIGRGSATIIADASLLEAGEFRGDPERGAALVALIDSLAAKAPDQAGKRWGGLGNDGDLTASQPQPGASTDGERD